MAGLYVCGGGRLRMIVALALVVPNATYDATYDATDLYCCDAIVP